VSKACLLDVNALVGLLWSVHSSHAKAHTWFAREKPLVLGCAMTELSFVRVSMADKTIAATFADAELVLASFISSLGSRYRFIDVLPSAAVLHARVIRSHKEVSDQYLCEVASSHNARLATLDTGIKHSAVLFIA
jgi:predicted nucleic acid-binding protein